MNKKLLITGTAGFILGNFIRKMVYEKQPYQLVSVDMVKNNTNSMYWNKNHTFYIADIRDQHIMDKIFQFEKPDIVIHGAAETFVDTSLTDPNSFVTSNVLGTQVIINCCVKYKVERLIHISTDEVYGQLTSEHDAPWTEDAILNPRNPYSATKAAAELLVKAAHDSYGLIYNITRSSNNYGPRQTSEKLIPKAIKCILDGEKIPIYGKGLQIRDWTHVHDNCAGIMAVLNNGVSNETYNIAANQEFTNIEVIQKICNAMNSGHELISYIPDPRMSHDFRYSIDSSKIKKLGWSPKIKFKEGVCDTVNWYLNNKYFIK
ncbi:RfbB dTDP-D-glucose 4,6-dehydratase [uncultured Caudovirales phage]|uniref:RfbB dTDP-D-glucose 4,6-dehydratase n=1 Tax=uncultured Caudovirales phage TaxID=2100421 RepID=A0A6J5RWY7_9CAUD|nr:RfbB dTDP-D-glucose 4,6-dehydratase [uncultured Caudovirales phage]